MGRVSHITQPLVLQLSKSSHLTICYLSYLALYINFYLLHENADEYVFFYFCLNLKFELVYFWDLQTGGVVLQLTRICETHRTG